MEKMSLTEPKCDHCRHLRESDTEYICEAFPDGIPIETMWEKWDSECVPGIKFDEDIE
ncbi:MAG: hypothetical protein NC305_13345 [Lachnospiraceae bacterium]|nr:hypothetical protein [Butyrivibrio sp.]MCM1344017.1 hypothetical protein [Muribaculaceae bacterium]MCM1411516.1 hypothetical protein [Lachnospiraceae bacterium]